jgi:guanylate kinase
VTPIKSAVTHLPSSFLMNTQTLPHSPSHTTCKPRIGEDEGINYFFVILSKFSSLISQEDFVEQATFSGNQCGTSKKTIADQMVKGLVLVLAIGIL